MKIFKKGIFWILIIIAHFCFPLKVNAQDISFEIRVVEEKTLEARIAEFNFPSELTPLVIPQPNGKRFYVLTGGWSFLCEESKNVLDGAVLIPRNQCRFLTHPEYVIDLDQNGRAITLPPNTFPFKDWKLTYDGIISLHLVENQGNYYLIAFRHGESHNVRWGDNLYQQRIFPNIRAEDCASGYDSQGLWHQCWPSFLSFSTMGYLIYSPAANNWQNAVWNDEGPIIWPTEQVRNSNKDKIGDGPYLAQSFINEGFIYIFYWRGNTVRLVRAPLSSLGKPGNWYYYYQGNFSIPALPGGFDKENIDQYYEVAVNQFTPLSIRRNYPNSFFTWWKVVRLKNTPFFLALTEEGPDQGKPFWTIEARISSDLINWSEGRVLEVQQSEWGRGRYNYPVPFDTAGFSSEEIDPHEFWILGKSLPQQYALWGMRVKFQCLSPPAPQGLTPAGIIKPGRVAFSWNRDSQAAFYSLRINDLTNPWNGSCQNPNEGDFCQDFILNNSFIAELKPGRNYHWWLHQRNVCGDWSQASTINNLRTIGPLDVILNYSRQNQDLTDFNNDRKTNAIDFGEIIRLL